MAGVPVAIMAVAFIVTAMARHAKADAGEVGPSQSLLRVRLQRAQV